MRLVGDLLEDQEQQRRDLELDHRPTAGQRGTGGEAGERLLGQWRVDDPVRTELGEQSGGDVVDGDTDVLAEHEHGLVALHLVGQRAMEGLEVGQNRHYLANISIVSTVDTEASPVPVRPRSPLRRGSPARRPTSGGGLPRAKPTALSRSASTSASISARRSGSILAPWMSTGSRERPVAISSSLRYLTRALCSQVWWASNRYVTTLQKRGACPGPGARDTLAGRVEDGLRIHAVDVDGRYAERRRTAL